MYIPVPGTNNVFAAVPPAIVHRLPSTLRSRLPSALPDGASQHGLLSEVLAAGDGAEGKDMSEAFRLVGEDEAWGKLLGLDGVARRFKTFTPKEQLGIAFWTRDARLLENVDPAALADVYEGYGTEKSRLSPRTWKNIRYSYAYDSLEELREMAASDSPGRRGAGFCVTALMARLDVGQRDWTLQYEDWPFTEALSSAVEDAVAQVSGKWKDAPKFAAAVLRES